MRAVGDRFQVELFNFHFRGLGGRTCHLLGLREWGDTDNTIAPALTAISQLESFAGRCSVAVTIDSAQEEMPVLSFSEGFKQLMPHVARPVCLLSNFVEDRIEFIKW